MPWLLQRYRISLQLFTLLPSAGASGGRVNSLGIPFQNQALTYTYMENGACQLLRMNKPTCCAFHHPYILLQERLYNNLYITVITLLYNNLHIAVINLGKRFLVSLSDGEGEMQQVILAIICLMCNGR